MAPTTQDTYGRVPSVGKFGQIAKPNAGYWIETFDLTVPQGHVNPVPGEPVIYESGNVEPIASAAEMDKVMGVLGYELTDVAPLEYGNNETVKVVIDGIMWCKAGAALRWGDLLEFDTAARDWIKLNPSTNLGELHTRVPVCVSPSPVADGEIFLLYVKGFFKQAD